MKRITSDGIAAALRKRICLEPPSSMVTLHEHALAQEFGVSRTPVRQALQRLAYERLVEVRSGVGTVVMPLDEATRESDQELAFALLKVAKEIEGKRPLSNEAATRLRSVAFEVAEAEQIDIETNYQMRVESLDVMAEDMASPILADALKAAIWRLFRWRMAEAKETPDGFDPRFRPVMLGVGAATREGTLEALFDAMLEARREER